MSAEISTTNSTTTSAAADSLSDPLTPPLEALYWTQYGTWYPIFRKHAPKSTVIDIDSVQPELLEWLDGETFVLPDGSGPSTTTPTAGNTSDLASASSSGSARGEAGDDSDSDSDADEQAVRLPELDAAIRSVISKYDGPVFPKLNWSAPLDASFMLAGNTLQCWHPEDVYLLLKSSEFAGRDLEQISATTTTTTTSSSPATEMAIRPQLVLKKWFALNRSYEFRCFVRSRALIAITQRDATFYEHLQSALLQSRIRSAIWEFHEQVFGAEARWGLDDYVMDVYLTKGLDRVWLVDVNPWLPRTDPLLWDYDALERVHRRERQLRSASSSSANGKDAEQLGDGVVRLHLHPQHQPTAAEHNSPPLAWSASDTQLRILSDRRLTAGGGTGATYSSNMVPKDLVEFATSSTGTNGAMSVDQIVKRWNDQIDAEEA